MKKVWIDSDGRLEERVSLWETLMLEVRPHSMISLVGAGGKTGTMYRLADELAAQGKRVVVTTSTHIFRPEDRRVLITEHAAEAEFYLRKPGILVVGLLADHNKLRGLAPEEGAILLQTADVVLVEADGAKGLPLKVPNDKEPVIWPETTAVLGCIGLDGIGKPLKEVCFRLEDAKILLEKQEDELVTAEDVAKIISSREGTGKMVGSREYRVILNKADTKKDLEASQAVINELKNNSLIHAGQCVITSYCW